MVVFPSYFLEKRCISCKNNARASNNNWTRAQWPRDRPLATHNTQAACEAIADTLIHIVPIIGYDTDRGHGRWQAAIEQERSTRLRQKRSSCVAGWWRGAGVPVGSSPVTAHTAGPRLCPSAGEWRPRDLCRRVGRRGPGPGFLLCSPPATQESGQSLTVRIRQLPRPHQKHPPLRKLHAVTAALAQQRVHGKQKSFKAGFESFASWQLEKCRLWDSSDARWNIKFVMHVKMFKYPRKTYL